MQSNEEEKSHCWKRTGVWGRETPRCPELAKVIHCRNCEMFIGVGRSLLESGSTEEYRATWAAFMAAEKSEELPGAETVVIFRIGGEWLAIHARVFAEIIDPVVPHTIPHRKDSVLRGLVNVHGELQLCVSLKLLLGVEEAPGPRENTKVYKRMVVVDREGDKWVFSVDEIHGIHRIPPDRFQKAPVTVSKGQSTFTRDIFEWEEKRVAFLDEELLFGRLERSLK